MDSTQARDVLDRLIRERGESYAALSRLLGRNAAYVQQFIKRGTPEHLDEHDRALLARFFGVSETVLGGREGGGDGLIAVPRLSVGASAGPGSLVELEAAVGHYGFDSRWLKRLCAGRPEDLSVIRVEGDSMIPTLVDGDDVLVDRSDAGARLRDGVYVLRRDDALMVKRLAVHPGSGTLTIASDNPAYPTWADCKVASVDVVGRVVWAGRRIG